MPRRVPAEIAKAAKDGKLIAKYAQELWREYAPLLEAAGRLTDLDYVAFERLCMAYGGLKSCEAKIMEDGEVIETYQERGDKMRIVKHPASARANEHSRTFLDLCDRFGLNPKARGMLKAADAPDTPNDQGLD